jgi:hypothetical protein
MKIIQLIYKRVVLNNGKMKKLIGKYVRYDFCKFRCNYSDVDISFMSTKILEEIILQRDFYVMYL